MIPGQRGIEEYIPMPNEAGAAMQQGITPAMAQAACSVVEIKKDMPVEQIYSLLTREKAASVVVPVGFNKGKTLGQVALEKPESLDWYVSSYGGPDNLLRAAAEFLLNAAFTQAI